MNLRDRINSKTEHEDIDFNKIFISMRDNIYKITNNNMEFNPPLHDDTCLKNLYKSFCKKLNKNINKYEFLLILQYIKNRDEDYDFTTIDPDINLDGMDNFV